MNKKRPKDRKGSKDLFRIHEKIGQKKERINVISVIMFFSNVKLNFLRLWINFLETQLEILLIQIALRTLTSSEIVKFVQA